MLSPEQIIETAKKKGLDGIAVTDHDTIKGGLEAYRVNRDKNFNVIIGSEINTECDDIIGLFLNQEIKSRSVAEVIDEIHSQGGLAGLAHPYRKFKTPESIIERVDFVEGFNARSKKANNMKAYELSLKYNKPLTAGSDAHLGFEVGRGRTIFDSDLKGELVKGKVKIEGSESCYYLAHGLSVTTEKYKKTRGI
jgi:predicted metal-dependent phosphoesterase TrpH